MRATDGVEDVSWCKLNAHAVTTQCMRSNQTLKALCTHGQVTRRPA
jgi:hypothetical protein